MKRCIVCGRPTNHRGYCPDPISCNYTGRLRIGVSERWARKLRADEWKAARR